MTPAGWIAARRALASVVICTGPADLLGRGTAGLTAFMPLFFPVSQLPAPEPADGLAGRGGLRERRQPG